MIAQICVFAAVGLLFSSTPNYLSQAGYVNIIVGAWYVVIALLTAVTLLAPKQQTHTDREAAKRTIKNKRAVFLWSIVYVFMGFVAFLYSGMNELEIRALKTLVFTSIMLWCTLLMLRDRRTLAAARLALAIVVFWSVLTNSLEFFLPGKFLVSTSVSLDLGRAAGFYANPNISGTYIVLGTLLSVTALPRRLRLAFFGLAGYGVLLTFSRSGMLMWAIALIGLSFKGVFPLNRYLITGISAALISLFLVMQFSGTFKDVVESANLGKGAKERLQYDEDDASVQGRLFVAERSLQLISESPVYGWGLGSAKSGYAMVQSHNQFLYLGVEQGAIGLIVLLSLFLILFRYPLDISAVFVACLFVAFMFNHNMLEYPETFVAVAILCGMNLLRNDIRTPPENPQPAPKVPGSTWKKDFRRPKRLITPLDPAEQFRRQS
jgi:O-antigen ligase